MRERGESAMERVERVRCETQGPLRERCKDTQGVKRGMSGIE